MVGVCCGVIGWPPQAFWAASLSDVVAAIRGWRRANVPPVAAGPPKPMSAARLDELMAQYPD